jgi:3-oxoacyl-[acyl-carrier protein] reductase
MGERLSGRVAVVTGGGSGIGRATSLLLASEGSRVAVLDRDADRARQVANEIEAHGGTGLDIEADVADPRAVDTAFELIATQLGPVEILVNNAGGVFPGHGHDITDQAWQSNLQINLSGALHCARAALRQMLQSGDGTIVNISSLTALHPIGDRAGYAAAKAGLLGLTRSLALDYASRGIRVNAVCPGAIATPLLLSRFEESGVEETVLGNIPLGRLGQPSEVAHAVLFLVSGECGFITGQTLVVDGGGSLP